MEMMINNVKCFNPNTLTELQPHMWFKTNKDNEIRQIKYIDTTHPSGEEIKFPIVYCTDDKTCWGLDSVVAVSWNPNELKDEKLRFSNFLNEYKGFMNKVYSIIDAKSYADGENYTLRSIDFIDFENDKDVIFLNVEFYKFQSDINTIISVPYNVFYNEESFKKFMEDNKIKGDKRKVEEQNKIAAQSEVEIEKAKQLLKKAGFIVKNKNDE